MTLLRHPAILAGLTLALLGASDAARAAAPVGRYAIGTDTVLDHQTNLRWQRTPPASTYTLAEAAAYCQAYSGDGFTSWRVPEMRELMSILDLSTTNPAVDAVAFPGTPAEAFWTATIYAPDNQYAPPTYYQTVEFDYGIGNANAETADNNVRCVR